MNHFTKSIVFVTAIVLSGCATQSSKPMPAAMIESTPVAPVAHAASIVGTWDCKTTASIKGNTLSVNLEATHQDQFTQTGGWLSQGKMFFETNGSMGADRLDVKRITNTGVYATEQRKLDIITQQFEIPKATQTINTKARAFLHNVLKGTRAAVTEDIKNKKATRFDITELTDSILHYASNEPELNQEQQSRTACTRAK